MFVCFKTYWLCLGGSPEGIKCFGQGDRPEAGEGENARQNHVIC